jgi:hypothetical protein
LFRYQKDHTKLLKRTVEAMAKAVIDKNTKRQRHFDRFAFFYRAYNRLLNFVVMLFSNIVHQNSEVHSYGQMT